MREEDEEVKPYVIVAEIGKGSFATVYKGYHSETVKQVAIKTVSRSTLTTKLFENLQSEIEILKALSHRHITRLLDIVRAEKNIYLIMEYCSGGDLTNYIKKRGRVEGLQYAPHEGAKPQYYGHPSTGGLDEVVVRCFLRQLARALKFLRQRNLVHRDIKPQNLLLNPVGEEEIRRGHPIGVPVLKIADFGFARSLPNAMLAETLCGSPLYMAPEILRYEKYDAKADLWSVGAVLYEMAVGKPPFRANNYLELIKKIERSKGVKFPDEDPRHQPSSDEKPVPQDIKQLIRMLLTRKPIERSNFEEFFTSTAVVQSKFPRPRQLSPIVTTDFDSDWRGYVPEHHNIIPPEVLDPKALIPPSDFHFRRRDSAKAPPLSPPPTAVNELGGMNDGKPLSAEASIIPGETEEDGLLRREYVLVGDTRAVEFTRAVDEISTSKRQPLGERPVERADYSPLESPIPSSSANTFPPVPNLVYAPPLSSSPSSVGSRGSNALTRALSMASKKLFSVTGIQPSSHYRDSSVSSTRRNPLPVGQSPVNGDGVGRFGDGAARMACDPMEEELLAQLEDLAQKADVLTHWADEMYEFVKAVPIKPLPDPNKFEKRKDEADKQANKRKNADIQAEYNATSCVALYMLLMSFSKKGIDKLADFQEHMKMKHPDGKFVVSEGFDDGEFVRAWSRVYSYLPDSLGVVWFSAVSWFKEHFMKCDGRVLLVKTWLPTRYTEAPQFLDQMIYDHALTLSRSAARKELLDQALSPDECEKLYKESLWCLYALQDDLLQEDNPFLQEDRETITTCGCLFAQPPPEFYVPASLGIKRTKLRLIRCKARMGMNDRDRLRDARADKNLDDVDRLPPPWEPQVAQPQPRVPGSVPPTPSSPLSRGVPVPRPLNGTGEIPAL
ncbi:other/ULK/ULK protein kinase [Thelephora terrestris]|uniref:non-specific serine/threonine protein kinase n=1 Tax=Thelephora terrestris TaxID=56493 RepID=A0A9P6HAN0_9AGAM|nr:other/ULK/ULK protein kinase [Thelephora terrestris]